MCSSAVLQPLPILAKVINIKRFYLTFDTRRWSHTLKLGLSSHRTGAQVTVGNFAVLPDERDVGRDDGVGAVADEPEALLVAGRVLKQASTTPCQLPLA